MNRPYRTRRSFDAGLPVAEALRRYTVPEKFSSLVIFAWGISINSAIVKFHEQFQRK